MTVVIYQNARYQNARLKMNSPRICGWRLDLTSI